jgi:hypothetical protein
MCVCVWREVSAAGAFCLEWGNILDLAWHYSPMCDTRITRTVFYIFPWHCCHENSLRYSIRHGRPACRTWCVYISTSISIYRGAAHIYITISISTCIHIYIYNIYIYGRPACRTWCVRSATVPHIHEYLYKYITISISTCIRTYISIYTCVRLVCAQRQGTFTSPVYLLYTVRAACLWNLGVRF